MNEVSTIGVDLAKNVFQVHGVDEKGAVVVRRQLKRKEVLAFFARLAPCLVGMEACGTAHYWSREIKKLGHTVKLMPPAYVKAYLKRGKHDAADAEAICEAVSRPSMRGVAEKSVEQQSVLMLHRARDFLIRQRTQAINALRGHLSELGIVAAQGHEGVKTLLAIVTDEADVRVPAIARVALGALVAALSSVSRDIAVLDQAILAAHRTSKTSCRLETVPGVGPILASAVAATAGDARQFASARGFAASLGLTPRITGTGGTVTLGPITKKGDRYLRRLLIMGAASVLSHAKRRPHKHVRLLAWLGAMPFKKAAVALANKIARTLWALLVRGGTYRQDHRPPALAATA